MLGREDLLGCLELVPRFRDAAGEICIDLTFDAIGGNAAAVWDVFHAMDANCVKVNFGCYCLRAYRAIFVNLFSLLIFAGSFGESPGPEGDGGSTPCRR